MEPIWLIKARTYLGIHEFSGPKTNENIARWLQLLHLEWKDDETPWCATFVGGVLEECGIPSTKSAWAKSYLNWGRKLIKPEIGCIAVLTRGANNGHVAFYVGSAQSGSVKLLGGNQNDEVNVTSFPEARVLSYRWPTQDIEGH